MKNLFFLIFIIFFATTSLHSQTPPDTTKKKYTEIRISEEGIWMQTEEGKKTKLSGKQLIVKIKPESLPEVEKKIQGLSEKLSDLEVSIEQEDVVKFGRDIIIEEHQKVNGDVVAIGGGIIIKGLVTGNAVAIGGKITLKETAIISGDAVAIGGSIEKEPGATIKGEEVDLGFIPLPGIPHWGIIRGTIFLARIFLLAFLLFLGIIVIALVPKNVSKTKAKIEQGIFKSALIGFVGEILILPVFILLVVTVIGIPVAFLVQPVFLIIAFVLGYTATCYFVGEKIRQNTNLKPSTPVGTVVVGILVVESISLLASIFGYISLYTHFLTSLSWILSFFGFAIAYIIWTIGFGAAIRSFLGTRPKKEVEVSAIPAV